MSGRNPLSIKSKTAIEPGDNSSQGTNSSKLSNHSRQQSNSGTPRTGSSAPPKRVIVFDFDQTISVHHVFSCLAGYVKSNPLLRAPYAQSERGQFKRVLELERESKGRFCLECLGGHERIAKLNKAFLDMRRNGAQLYVCSKGLIGPIRLILQQTQLLQHFANVYGRIDAYYGQGSNPNPYDEQAINGWEPKNTADELFAASHLDRHQQDKWGEKAVLCLKLSSDLARATGSKEDLPVMLVEDDRNEIAKAAKKGIACCYVEERMGMTEKEIREILNWSVNGQSGFMC